MATFSILGDLVREVGGDARRARRPGRCRHRRPHLPAQARRRAHALPARRALVSNGLGFEVAGSTASPRRPPSKVAPSAATRRRARSCRSRRRPATKPRPRPITAGRTRPRARRYVANIAQGPVAADGLPTPPPYARAPSATTQTARRSSTPVIRREIARVPPEPRRQAITGHSSVPCHFRQRLRRAAPPPRGYRTWTASRLARRRRRGLIRQGALSRRSGGAVRREHEPTPALVDRDRPATPEQSRGRPAALQRRARPAPDDGPGPDLRGDDAPQRDGAGGRDVEELTWDRSLPP